MKTNISLLIALIASLLMFSGCSDESENIIPKSTDAQESSAGIGAGTMTVISGEK